MTGSDVLVVMAKHPAPGAVKTRLAAMVGAAAACALYTAFLRDIAVRFAVGPWRLVWAVAPDTADLRPIVGAVGEHIPQRGATLGERMAAVFAALLSDRGARVVMVGADAPHLATAQIAEGFAALGTHDAVFVPTRDGGYCAVGLRASHDVFTPVTMGRSDVFARTCTELEARGLSYRVLASSFDIDELTDVRALAALLDSGATELPYTAEVLGHWRRAGVL